MKEKINLGRLVGILSLIHAEASQALNVNDCGTDFKESDCKDACKLYHICQRSAMIDKQLEKLDKGE